MEKLTDAERAACEMVERLMRERDAAEARFWRTQWFSGIDGREVSVSVYPRTRLEPGEPAVEIAGLGLADALDRVAEFRCTEKCRG